MPSVDRRALTSRQRQVLATIRRLTDQTGYPPTLREIGEAVDLGSPSSVHHHVRILERAGLLSPAEGRPRARAIAPTRDGAAAHQSAPLRTSSRYPRSGARS